MSQRVKSHPSRPLPSLAMTLAKCEPCTPRCVCASSTTYDVAARVLNSGRAHIMFEIAFN